MGFVAEWGRSIVAFVQANQDWAAPVCFVLAFGESLAVVSFFLPATLVLIGIGALAAHADLSLPPIFVAAVVGAALGDWVSYWVGRRFDDRIASVWPLSRHPDLLIRARRIIDRWGAVGVFIGRFLGPLRATVPLIAGLCAMPPLPFQLANWLSALLWAAIVLAPGVLGVEAVRSWLA